MNSFYKYLIIFKTTNLDNASFEKNRNNRANGRDALIRYINNLSLSDMDSVRTQASMLSMVTSQPEEITRSSEVRHSNLSLMSYR
jgi:hypothetical protein